MFKIRIRSDIFLSESDPSFGKESFDCDPIRSEESFNKINFSIQSMEVEMFSQIKRKTRNT